MNYEFDSLTLEELYILHSKDTQRLEEKPWNGSYVDGWIRIYYKGKYLGDGDQLHKDIHDAIERKGGKPR